MLWFFPLSNWLSASQKASLKAERTIAVQEKRMLEVARGVLSNFGFEGDLATAVPLRHLSGGQKACLKFAKLSLEPVHILLLDEPTNHLDSEAREALIRAIADFEGGVVAVTHDEHLVYRLIHCNWTTSELLLCRNGSIEKTSCLGASCLSALKQELRRAEEEEVTSLPEAAKKRVGRVSTHADHVSADPVTTSAVPTVIRVTSTKTSSAPPPWLLSRRRRVRDALVEKIDMQSLGDSQVFAVKVKQEKSDAAQTASLLASGSLAACQEEHAVGGQRVHMCHKTEETNHGGEFLA
jgi:ABC-type multidrug transport system ATPase subunit